MPAIQTSCKRSRGNYNERQWKEIVLTCAVLRGCVERTRLRDWESRNGRSRVARRGIELCLLLKTYLNVSYRRFTGVLKVFSP